MSDQVQAAPAAVATPSPISESTQSDTIQEETSSIEDSSSDVVADLQDQAKHGTPSQKVEAKKLLKSLKLKVDGKEYEEKLPFEIPDTEEAREYMTRQLQMSKMASKRAQDYSDLEKDVTAYLKFLKEDTIAALSDPSIGVDIKKLAAKVIEREIEDSRKSPEQLKAEEYERKYKELEEKQKKSEKEQEEREFTVLQQAEFTRISTEMDKAFESAGVPNNPYFVKKMADLMLMGLQDGLDVRPADVLPQIREEFESDIQSMIKSLDDDKLEKMIGKDTFNRIRKKNIAKAKPTNPKPSTQPTKTEAKVDTGPKKTIKQLFGI